MTLYVCVLCMTMCGVLCCVVLCCVVLCCVVLCCVVLCCVVDNKWCEREGLEDLYTDVDHMPCRLTSPLAAEENGNINGCVSPEAKPKTKIDIAKSCATYPLMDGIIWPCLRHSQIKPTGVVPS